MPDVLEELRSRLHEAAMDLRSGSVQPSDLLALIEDCARLASEAASFYGKAFGAEEQFRQPSDDR